MNTVGVRELKARLSHHLKRVQAGHTLTITDRGRAVARLEPMEAAADTAWIMKLVAEGKVSWSGGKPKGSLHPVKLKGKKLASDYVIEDRGVTAYLDTSSLVKLLVDEPGADTVHALRRRSTVLATAVIAYAEVRGALAAMRRAGALTAAAHASVRREFERDWLDLALVPVDVLRCRHAGDLAERHGLRGFDSVHLACYLAMAEEVRPALVTFSSFDTRLLRAAAAATRTARRRAH